MKHWELGMDNSMYRRKFDSETCCYTTHNRYRLPLQGNLMWIVTSE